MSVRRPRPPASPKLQEQLRSRTIAVVGMNGVGKTNFGKRLASALSMERVDSDEALRKLIGDAHAFIEERGWDAFRKIEEETVLRELRPGRIVTLGGGAVESAALREALKKDAIVIWIQAGTKKIHTHLARAKVPRPEFKHGLHPEAVSDLLETRNPLYKEVADIALFSSTPFARQVPVAMLELEKLLNRGTRHSPTQP